MLHDISLYISHFILTNRQVTVVDLKTLKVNTGASVSESKVETISVVRSKGKGCTILLLTKATWLLKTSYKLIVASGSCCSGIHSIPLIAVHVNIELGTRGIKSAFLEIGSDIHNHLSGINVADVLCEEPVVLCSSLSEIT